MNREILFAAKDLNGIWHEGLVIKDYSDTWFISNGQDTRQIDPETISQWTGLKDKSGKYIFEGDRIRFERNGVIREEYIEFRMCAFTVGFSLNFMLHELLEIQLEVIGNRFDNPELI